jgi:hypothetical protein
MKLEWKKVLVKSTVWLAAEIILNLLGLDTLADYSEFLYEQEIASLGYLHKPTITIVNLAFSNSSGVFSYSPSSYLG